ncbi:MAG TPA: DegT/DnrJ/EryC1/StrS family aminotransferase, partial [Mesotoga sp.]|nr:DegT/DnrJ/EryC1/StrS family aminotransferase [Mesotoga sp.]
GLAQFERLPDFLQKKRRYSEIYREILTSIKGIEFQEEYPDSISSWWLSSVKINHPTKDIPQIQKELKEKGIPTRRIFVPITEFPPYAKYKGEEYPNSYELYEKGLNLPSSTLNSEEQVEFVARSIVDVIEA